MFVFPNGSLCIFLVSLRFWYCSLYLGNCAHSFFLILHLLFVCSLSVYFFFSLLQPFCLFLFNVLSTLCEPLCIVSCLSVYLGITSSVQLHLGICASAHTKTSSFILLRVSINLISVCRPVFAQSCVSRSIYICSFYLSLFTLLSIVHLSICLSSFYLSVLFLSIVSIIIVSLSIFAPFVCLPVFVTYVSFSLFLTINFSLSLSVNLLSQMIHRMNKIYNRTKPHEIGVSIKMILRRKRINFK